MNPDFRSVMAKRSDSDLALILTVNRSDYQEEAVKAAQEEFDKRNLDLENFANKVLDAEEDKIQPENHEKEFDVLQKAGTFLLPAVLSYIGRKICFYIPVMYAMEVFALLILVLQFFIYNELKKKNYVQYARAFKTWSIYGWVFAIIIRAVLFLLAILHYYQYN